jgi:flagellar basal body rod protein FlgG
MFLNPNLGAALDRIEERAADVRRAFTGGALPQRDDIATAAPVTYFTLDPLSVSAPEGTYFITRDARGDLGYTRDGAFALRDGRLVDQGGNTVQGTMPDGTLNDVRIDPVDAALARAGDERIESDGTMSYARGIVDPRNAGRQLRRVAAGRLALARFPAGTRMESNDGLTYRPPTGVAAELSVPASNRTGPLSPMHRDRSRIDVDRSLLRLKEAYMAFDALHAAESAKSNLGKTAMDLVK